jgi:hypothetical protein
MSALSAIRDAWNTNVWVHDSITNITPQIFSYDVLKGFDQSEYDASKLYNQRNNKIHFFQYWIEKVAAKTVVSGGSSVIYNYRLVIEYYKEANKDGTTAHDTQTDLETLITRINTGLGRFWDGTVDFWQFDTAPIKAPELGTIDGRKVWGSELIFVATRLTTI